ATQFQLAAMTRITQAEHNRRDFHLCIDEFQNFSTDAFAAMLAEARKFRLCLTLCHQYVDQIAEPVRQAVFGNVGTLISFRIGNTDAEVLEKEFGKGFSAQHFVDLDRYDLFVKLLVDGVTAESFRGRSLPPVGSPIRGRREKLIQRSRERFAMPRTVVGRKLQRWLKSI